MAADRSKIFVSYSTKNERFVRAEVLPSIKRANRKHWFAPKSIGGGDDWRMELLKGLDRCGRLLVVVSRESQESAYVKLEVASATKRLLAKQARLDARRVHRAILPVKIDERGKYGEVERPVKPRSEANKATDAKKVEVDPYLIHPYLTLVNYITFPHNEELDKLCSGKGGRYTGDLKALSEEQRQSIKEYVDERQRAQVNLHRAIRNADVLRWGFKPFAKLFAVLTHASTQRVLVAGGLFAAIFFLLPLSMKWIGPESRSSQILSVRGLSLAEATSRLERAEIPVSSRQIAVFDSGQSDDVVLAGHLVPSEGRDGGEQVVLTVNRVTEVPEGVIGATLAEAKALLEEKHLAHSSTLIDGFDGSAADGVVLTSYPAPGSRIHAGAEVILTVNRVAEVPGGMAGLPVAEAVGLLEASHVKAYETVVTDFDRAAADGAVLACHPESGSQVPRASGVVLTVNRAAIVPDVVGISVDAALDLLGTAKLENTGVPLSGFDPAMEAGRVLTSYPPPGERVPSGSFVTLVVNQFHTLPDLLGKPVKAASSQLLAAGLIRGELPGSWAEETVVRGSSRRAGERVPTDSSIVYLVLSDDSASNVIIPEGLVGLPASTAVAALKTVGVEAEIPRADEHMLVQKTPSKAQRGSAVVLELKETSEFPEFSSSAPSLAEVLERLADVGIAPDLSPSIFEVTREDGRLLESGESLDARSRVKLKFGLELMRGASISAAHLLARVDGAESEFPSAPASWPSEARELIDRMDEYGQRAAALPAGADREQREVMLRDRDRLKSLFDRIVSITDEDRRWAKFGIPPQDGLEPLGQNLQGKWEFWMTNSGSRPGWIVSEEDPGKGSVQLKPDMGIVFVLLEGGTFLFSDKADAEGKAVDPTPADEISIEAFFLSKYELTNAQWIRLGGKVPSANERARQDERRLYPTSSVTWHEGTAWASAAGLVLPTEEQWEYACRAGTKTLYFFGTRKTKHLMTYGWFGGNSGGHQHPIGELLPNPWGFYDIIGNMYEMCSTRYGAGAPEGSVDARGGGWSSSWGHSMSAHRGACDPAVRSACWGFRPARLVTRKE